MKRFEGLVPLLPAHVDDAEIGIGSSGLGIQLKDGAESVLGFVQLAVGESVLPTLKKRCGISAIRHLERTVPKREEL